MTTRQPQARNKDDGPAWTMLVIACYLTAWAAWASWLRHSWLGMAGVYILAGGIIWCIVRLNRAEKSRNPF